MTNILITGGAGFIGSNFVKYMLNKYPNYNIINLDKLTYSGNLANLEDIKDNPNYSFIKGDIADKELVEKIFGQKIDYCVNFAAETHVDRSIVDSSIFIHSNVVGTQVLLDASLKYGIKKYLQISTDEVYGSLGQDGYFTETTKIAPNNPYSASKAAADMLVRSYFKTYNLPINITRCTNNYGCNQHPEKLIPHMIIKALKDQTLPVYGDGKNIRDWVHVLDHSRAVDAVLHKGKPGEIYNIGSNSEKQNIEIVKIILDTVKKPHTLITYVKDRPGHDKRYAIDYSKIKHDLGWNPQVEFDCGLQQTINWYLDNTSWWQNLV